MCHFGIQARQGKYAVDWYQTITELIDLRSFSNLWYWIGLAVMWSSASHWVLGVPYDVIMRARRSGGKAEDDLVLLVRLNVDRILYYFRAAGAWLVAFGAFWLSLLLTFGFYYDAEFAQAVTFLFAPMLILFALSIRTALRLEGETDVAVVYRRLYRHRLSIQFLGMVSILLTSMYGMWMNMQTSVLN